MRYFSPILYISAFKRYFHCIMRTDHSARDFQRRNELRHTKIAIFHRFWRQLFVISLPFEIFRILNAIFTALCVPNVVHALSSVETSPDTRKSQSFVDSDNNYALFLSRLRYFVVSTHLSLHSERRARVFYRRNRPWHTQIAIIHRCWRQLCVIFLPFSMFRRLNAIFTALCVQNGVHAFSGVETSPDTRK